MGVSSMSVLSRSAWLAAFLVTLSGPALAFDTDFYTRDKFYGTSGNWSISINLARKSCFMNTTYNDDTTIEVGGDHGDSQLTYYMMFGNPNWTYKESQEYAVVVRYDRRSTWNGDGVGVKINALHGAAIEGIKEAVVSEFAGMNTLTLKIGSKNHGNYDLAGSRKALAQMFACIKEIEDGSLSLDAIAQDYEAGNTTPSTKGDDGGRRDEGAVDGGESEKKGAESGKGPMYSTGTGFFVNGDGYLLTNAHVVDGCQDAFVRRGSADITPAAIIAREKTNDLALLKIDGKTAAFGKFRGTPQIRLGDTIVVFGYPLTGYLSSSGNLGTGLVSSLAGSGDDVTQMQISAPVQSGNSGGAVVDQSGHVVGIVVAKSNIQARGTAEHPDIEVIQNVNFAIKAGLAQFFLDANQVSYDIEPPGDDMKTPDVAAIARNFTAQVMCEIKK
ncbi:MAG: trypsin-like peptidase protein [Proteobacteria bacterium]|nr:trypsin-like peptidase protein [Pseudomonadota bacterium]